MLEYYQAFFDALATFVGGPVTGESEVAFAREYNNLHLIASTAVLDRLHDYQGLCRDPDRNGNLEQHNMLLAKLLTEARRDLGLPGRDVETRHVQLLSFRRGR